MNLIPKINGDYHILSSQNLLLTGLKIEDSYGLLEKSTIDMINSKFSGANKTKVLLVPSPNKMYQIKINNNTIIIETNKELAYSALITLISLKNELYQNMIFFDYPKYNHREFSIDVARHFFDIDEIKKIIDESANLKLNKIHLHLSDNQGWRVEISKYPLLHEIGGKIGYYTKQDIKCLVDYAKARQIDIIPEIDIPGHVGALITAYPEYSCKSEKPEIDKGYQKNDKTLCLGYKKTITFIKDILDEIIEIFPSKYIHIGYDEIDLSHNKKCPKCKEAIIKNNCHSINELVTKFMNEIANYLFDNNKQVIVWNDATKYGKLDERIIIQNWFDYPFDKSKIREFQNNRQFIFGSTLHTYLDYPNALIPLKNVYEYNPSINNSEMYGNNILGISSHIWTEVIDNNSKLEQMIFPRLIAFSENAWTINKDYKDFLNRMNDYLQSLKMCNIEYSNILEYSKEEEIQEIANFFQTFLNNSDSSFSPYQTLVGTKLTLELLKKSEHLKDIPSIALKLIKKEEH